MKNRRKRLLSAVLSLCMLAGLLAPAVCAEGEETITMEVATADQLVALAKDCRTGCSLQPCRPPWWRCCNPAGR